ncbi:MAG: helix-turn-helix domain-containing protein [Bryobacteraceae bacterium]
MVVIAVHREASFYGSGSFAPRQKGWRIDAIARKLSTSLPTVLLWRKRYESEGLAGILEDKPRSGRPKEISAEGQPRDRVPGMDQA